MPQLTALHIYPVKSTYRHSPDTVEVQPWGLAGDRRWMLADPTGRAVTQHRDPALARYRTEPHPDGSLTVIDPAGAHIRVPPPDVHAGPAAQGILFGTGFPTVETTTEVQAWFRERLGDVRLLHLAAPATSRMIHLDEGSPDASTSMVDGYPVHLTTTASLAALNHHLAQDHPTSEPQAGPLPMSRFRPNLVVTGTEPWEEDTWHRIKVGDVVLRTAELCGRCVVITLDQETGERRGARPLRALARHHRYGSTLAFGLSMVPERPEGLRGDRLGTVRLGDEITVLATRPRAHGPTGQTEHADRDTTTR
ncbi:MOSC domain-containing protein [Kitasatospora sp. NPDC001664]